MTKIQDHEYTHIAQSPHFRALMYKKKRFIIPATIFFLVFYLALPLLTSYTTILNQSAIGPISWAWIFAFAQFIMTWTLCTLYVRKAAKFDHMVRKLSREWGGQQ
ncbi:DUF485 domain-containing protein [Paenibacillus sp. ACRRX]|uniref:DUF485 domain-containing protein n=1 Tax=unclassified Paenibacillus TaxID=185978 RepID=UPI001EF3F1C1|nr:MULTISPECIES: DUF485 domain-containing protein [unclassified Paenibacillus]MCG7406254.1 DUF485 domain-containing protein [Paenibacillus sp. ACRRX]MDK8179287.1 DUF485 domain-containing protein [Paenibacillus sp. UMB4589-SE434]